MIQSGTRAVLFDFNRTIYDPELGCLYPGAAELLEQLAQNKVLLLVSKVESDREALLGSLGIQGHFRGVYYTEEKTPELFASILRQHKLSPVECIAVGDRVQGELDCAAALGMDTVWLRQGLFRDEMPLLHEPTHIVNSIKELRELLTGVA